MRPWRRRKKIRVRLVNADGSCFYCGRELTVGDSTLDHVVPRSRGGGEDEGNLVLACRKCNRRKSDHGFDRLACHLNRGQGLHLPSHLPIFEARL